MSQTPPYDLEAEGAVLSVCLLDGAASVDQVGDLLEPEHFYAEKHRRIFEACTQLTTASEHVDVTSVGSWLRDRGRLESAGGMGYLTEILAAAPAMSVAALRAYATTVRAKATLRSVLATCQKAAAEIYAGVPEVEPFVDGLETEIHDAVMARRMVTVRSMREVVTASALALRKREETGVVSGIPSGLVDLDGVTGGIHATDLTVVAARPGMGKTSLALCHAVEVAKRGHGVVMFSLEMPHEQFGNRAICLEARVNMLGMRTGRYSQTDWARIMSSTVELAKLPIFIEDTADMPLASMRTVVRRKQTELGREGKKLGLVVIDYLQLMTGRPGRHTRDEAVSEITRGLKAMAKEANVSVMALSQLNREVEKRSDKRPLLSDLRESGAIEQDADNVIFIYRDDYYDEESREPGVAEIHVAKQRNGPTGTVKVRFDAKYTRFDNLGYAEAAE